MNKQIVWFSVMSVSFSMLSNTCVKNVLAYADMDYTKYAMADARMKDGKQLHVYKQCISWSHTV